MDELMGSWFKYVVRLLGLVALVAILIAVFAKSKAQTERLAHKVRPGATAG